jgi:hypothetical protein
MSDPDSYRDGYSISEFQFLSDSIKKRRVPDGQELDLTNYKPNM